MQYQQALPQTHNYPLHKINNKNKVPLPGFKTTLGNINVSFCLSFTTWLAGVSILWIMAAVEGDQPWFPVMITSTAEDYPQNIIFKMGTLIPCAFWNLFILLVYWYMKGANASVGNVVKIPFWLNYLGWASFFFFTVTVSSIDDKKMLMSLHGTCASLFFVLMILWTILVTGHLGTLRNLNPNFISESSLKFKETLLWFYIITGVCLVFSAFKFKWGLPCAEWTGCYLIIVYIHSFARDFREYELSVFQAPSSVKEEDTTIYVSPPTQPSETELGKYLIPQVVFPQQYQSVYPQVQQDYVMGSQFYPAK